MTLWHSSDMNSPWFHSLRAVLPRGMSGPLHLHSGGIQLLQEDTHHLMIDTTPSKGWSLSKQHLFLSPKKTRSLKPTKHQSTGWFHAFQRPWGLTSTWLWFPVSSRWNPQNSDPARRFSRFPSISQFPVDSRVPLAVLHMAFLTVLSTSWRKKWLK